MATSSVFDLRGSSTLKADGTFGMTGKPIRGVRVVLEMCARAIATKRRSMRWSRSEGEDIGELENGDFTPTELEQKRLSLDRAIMGVEFVIGVQSTLTIDANRTARYGAKILIQDAGVYALAVSIDQAGRRLAELEAA